MHCSLEYLPFRDRAFHEVYCSHAIEHVDVLSRALRELLRVSDYHVLGRCPHRFGSNAHAEGHKWKFTRGWFVNRTGVSRRRAFFYFVPEEIEVEVFKIKAANARQAKKVVPKSLIVSTTRHLHVGRR